MSFEYLEHESDMGIKGVGKTQTEAFQEGARAMFNLMVAIDKVQNEEEVKIKTLASGLPELFVEYLNELLAQKDLSGFIFGNFIVDSISLTDHKYQLTGRAFGEKLDPEKHEIKTEVKAATFSGLKCGRENNEFYCQCVVDI